MSKREIIREIGNTLKELLQERGITPYKIALFGSFARGMSREDSDIDIIIVSKDFRDKSIFERVELTTGIGRELVRRFSKPFDIMYYSDEEWERGESLIINAAKNEGVVVD